MLSPAGSWADLSAASGQREWLRRRANRCRSKRVSCDAFPPGRAYFADPMVHFFACLSYFGIKRPARESRIASRIDSDSSDARIVALQAPFAKALANRKPDATMATLAVHESSYLDSGGNDGARPALRSERSRCHSPHFAPARLPRDLRRR